ncbi:MAG TPA: 2-succinyl-5-enolpyruvyl-6-hydroxy-3-cyclohexene-1-carboxylic-acid synthase, partial [Solirubrobacterales bacterium]|nr:2-succinyl-5-enolpyruvyl-6-hydroxy-3-cyclohexene-1-carboxylic-acid synthase [Solirubrobacterales bacterium]
MGLIDSTNRNTALASAMAQELSRCGLRLAVISPGSRSTPLAVALNREPGIETAVVIDERSAGYLALGAAQASGVPVALLCTSGTAAANYHPAICEADLSAVPLIVLTADRPPELRGIGAGQTIDQVKLYGSEVRWFCEVGSHEADDTGLLHYRSVACRSFALADGDPRPGPVHLNLAWRDPLDPIAQPDAVTATNPLALNGRMAGDGPAPLTTVSRRGAKAGTDLAARIAAEPRGLILAGRQTDPGLREPLADLARRSGFPICAEPTSQLRAGPHDRGSIVWRYDAIATDLLGEADKTDGAASGVGGAADATGVDLEPRLILRFGEFPTSKALRTWIGSLDRSVQIVVDPDHGWNEPTRLAERIVRAEPVAFAADLADALAALPAAAGGSDLTTSGSGPAAGGDGSQAGQDDFLAAWLAADAK